MKVLVLTIPAILAIALRADASPVAEPIPTPAEALPAAQVSSMADAVSRMHVAGGLSICQVMYGKCKLMAQYDFGSQQKKSLCYAWARECSWKGGKPPLPQDLHFHLGPAPVVVHTTTPSLQTAVPGIPKGGCDVNDVNPSCSTYWISIKARATASATPTAATA